MKTRKIITILLALFAAFVLAGCASVETFPKRPLGIFEGGGTQILEYDLNGDGSADLKEFTDEKGRVIEVEKRAEKKSAGWRKNLDEVDPKTCRHIVFLFDGVPYGLVDHLYRNGFFRAFHPPQKLISCFPPMTDLAFAQLFHSKKPLGFEAKYYDREKGRLSDGSDVFLKGLNKPGEMYMQYHTRNFYAALQYAASEWALNREIETIVKDFRRSRDRVYFAYLASTAGVGTDRSWTGIVQYLERFDRLTHQLIAESEGNVKVTMLADHGHTLMHARDAKIEKFLKKKGFRIAKHLASDKDVIVIDFGLVTNAMLYTLNPGSVAEALLEHPAVSHCIYPDGDAVIVSDRVGSAKIFERNGRFRYDDSRGDPLELRLIMAKLKEEGALDADGYVGEEALFKATVNHTYPDPLKRMWFGFNGLVENPPDLAVMLYDSYFNGSKFFSSIVPVNSTHGSLNNINMTTFIMSTGRPFAEPLGIEEAKEALEEMTGQPIEKVSTSKE